MTATKFDGFHARVAHVMAGLPKIDRKAHNDHGRYNYATADDVYRAIRGLMAEARLSIWLDIEQMTIEKIRNRKGEDTQWVNMMAVIRLYGPDGEDHPVNRNIMLPLTGPQSFEAATTYLQKQFLRQRFLIDTGERDADTFAPAEIEGVEKNPYADLVPSELEVGWDEDGLYCHPEIEGQSIPPAAIRVMPRAVLGGFQRELYRQIKRLLVDDEEFGEEVMNLKRSREWLGVLPARGRAELARLAAEAKNGGEEEKEAPAKKTRAAPKKQAKLVDEKEDGDDD